MTAHPDADPLLALAERVENGEVTTGLQEAILTAFGWRIQPHGWWANPAGKMATPPRYLSSLDAIASLQEAVLPGWAVYAIREYADVTSDVRLWSAELSRIGRLTFIASEAPTEPAARLAALLRAVAMERRDG